MNPIEKYAVLRRGLQLREEPVMLLRRPSEVELQARFYAGEFGLRWKAESGQSIEILSPGQWNREPGPDFVGAKLRLDGAEREGDIELDREAADWERHGHATNPAYGKVVLHVFFSRGRRSFFTRNFRHEEIPQVCLEASETMAPRAPRSSLLQPGAAAPGTTGLSDAEVFELVDAAAHYRLARKRQAWLRTVELHGFEETLFQALAAGLGYKNNKLPFLLTAQRVGIARAASPEGEAILFGVAGFLEQLDYDSAAREVRCYVRELWEMWWRIRSAYDRLILPPETWSFAALRPTNHPHRRLGALAVVARRFGHLAAAVQAANAQHFLECLESFEHSFWNERFSLRGEPLKHPASLVGEQRAADLAANILAPAAPAELGMKILHSLRPGPPSSKARKALVGLGAPAEVSRELCRSAWGQQGLLQVAEDFHSLNAGKILALFHSAALRSK